MAREKCSICLKTFYTNCRNYAGFTVIGYINNEHIYHYACFNCINKEKQYVNKLRVQKNLLRNMRLNKLRFQNNIRVNVINNLLDTLSLNVIKSFL